MCRWSIGLGIAAGVPDYLQIRELEFEFLTREGYGVGVLDKKGRSSFALGEAAKLANETGELN